MKYWKDVPPMPQADSGGASTDLCHKKWAIRLGCQLSCRTLDLDVTSIENDKVSNFERRFCLSSYVEIVEYIGSALLEILERILGTDFIYWV